MSVLPVHILVILIKKNLVKTTTGAVQFMKQSSTMVLQKKLKSCRAGAIKNNMVLIRSTSLWQICMDQGNDSIQIDHMALLHLSKKSMTQKGMDNRTWKYGVAANQFANGFM